MTELSDQQITKLAKHIMRWMLEDEGLLWAVAVEQARGWTPKEYNEMMEDEDEE